MLVQTQGAGHWAATQRTSLGVIPEAEGTFTIFYNCGHGPGAWTRGATPTTWLWATSPPKPDFVPAQ